jgi:hypothetical protein
MYYLVDHPAAIKPRQIFMIQCQLQFVNNSKKKKKEKPKGTVLKAREKQATDCSNEIFWSFYSVLHVFLKFKRPNTLCPWHGLLNLNCAALITAVTN